MDILHTIILGAVEGLTEFLPISSTAHLVLAAQALSIAPTEFVKSFQIAIQLGAILAVLLLYWRKFFVDRETLKRVAVAFVPTAVIGFLLYNLFKEFLIESIPLIAWMLLLGGAVLLLFELFHVEKEGAVREVRTMSYRQSIGIGLAQALAIVPGVSRAGATIVASMFFGLSRAASVEFSFLLAVPTMLAATGYDLLQTGASFSAGEFGTLALGFLVSLAFALLAVKFLLRYIQKHTFAVFGVYRILIAIIFLFFFI